MSLPHLLLVDDSDAVLAYEQAALSGRYIVSTASNGRDGLKKCAELRPAAILLDLSMPEMSGDEMLVLLKADPRHADIPVIIVSAEKERAEACLARGAATCLIKPIRAEELRVTVARVIEEAQRRERRRGLAVIAVRAGTLEMGFPIDAVRAVLPQVATSPLPLGPHYLSEMFIYRGEPVCVLDLAHRLGVTHSVPPLERKLVVLASERAQIALCVDGVRDPEELPAEQVVWRSGLGGAEHGPLKEALTAVFRTGRGTLPVVAPQALFNRELLRELPAALRQVMERAA